MNLRSRVEFHDLHDRRIDFAEDVIAGLSRRPASIPPKYFYDARGSELFDAITRLPEYYLTRIETGLLERHAHEIVEQIGSGCLLVEPGGGSCAKVDILLQGLKPRAYVPMDISREHLLKAAGELATRFPWLEIHAISTDFTRRMALPSTVPGGARVAFFPGSSIGNFDPRGAVGFMRSIAELVGAGGHLLIGVDLKKDQRILQAAYDDSSGLTAQFNLNLLARINRELDGDIDLKLWRHRALYNETAGRIEMYLVSRRAQKLRIGEQCFEFAEGEAIHTENSYKYSVDEFVGLAAQAGFTTQRLWLDEDQWFSVHLLRL